jgi:hypothetical protein
LIFFLIASFLDRFGLFLVGRDLVEQRLECTGLFASFNQVDEKIIKMERVLGQRFGQRTAAFHVSLDRHDQLLHGRILVAAADDFERLHQRNAGCQHRGELAAENRYITGGYLALALEQARALFPDPARDNALAAQIGADGGFVRRHALAFDLVALAVRAFPKEGGISHYCCICHRLSLW